MRSVYFLFLVVVSIALAQQGPTRRALTPADDAALKEPISTGQRVVAALVRYGEDMPLRVGDSFEGIALLTATPTAEILHAYRYISDSDFAVCRRYRATPQVVPPAAPTTQPLLSMETSRGVLFFQANGEVALESVQ